MTRSDRVRIYFAVSVLLLSYTLAHTDTHIHAMVVKGKGLQGRKVDRGWVF